MFIEHGGARLYVETDGPDTAPALLLWPNGSSSLRVWDHLVVQITPRFHTIRIDIRGVGQSAAAPGSHDADDPQFTFEQYAADARRVLDQLGIAACHVWSQSWGSRPAIVFCALNNERVMSAALYAANLDLPDVEAQRKGSKLAAARQQAAGIKVPSPPVGMKDHANPDTVGSAMLALRKFDLASVVDRLTMPLLIGTGSLDPNLVSSRVIAERAENAQLSVLEDVGHNGILERPDIALERFINFHDNLETST
ncbi:MAG: hypothetical protein CMQ29_08265 [Gammaproteobacteria bacterium]|nr:hypothetical protein [Gammaproteobacteria bacterium]|tara:strand:+ start:2197 stop:2955 length:759 start_codon:yes stop_codon:yes gene_type:complete